MTSLTDKMGDWEREYRQDRHNSYGSATISFDARIDSEIAFITNLIADKDREGEEVRQETMRLVMSRSRKLVDEPDESIYLEEIEEMLYELDQEYLTPPTK